ncbi:hypothetical protein M9458_057588 [Cirrhinus mrigala]|uniref:Uncharacterized protein n=1 Tax=Cirrhinus mrigala TaxID=683832 RepID=A0ABD0MBV0_CIRMR
MAGSAVSPAIQPELPDAYRPVESMDSPTRWRRSRAQKHRNRTLHRGRQRVPKSPSPRIMAYYNAGGPQCAGWRWHGQQHCEPRYTAGAGSRSEKPGQPTQVAALASTNAPQLHTPPEDVNMFSSHSYPQRKCGGKSPTRSRALHEPPGGKAPDLNTQGKAENSTSRLAIGAARGNMAVNLASDLTKQPPTQGAAQQNLRRQKTIAPPLMRR